MNNYIETIYFPTIPLKIQIIIRENLLHKIFLYRTDILIQKHYKIHTKIMELTYQFFECYFFDKKIPPFSLPLDWSQVSDFQKKVYTTLMNHIPFGKTISYSELAQKIGKPKAFRAVGTALSKNPWPIVIPCHRVVGKRNSLGGFSCGIEIKKILLQHENIFSF